MSGDSFSASKTQKAQTEIDPRARNIFALFTKHNPKLNAETAKKYSELVIEASKKYNQDPYVIAAIIVHESTVNNKAVSKGGDYGLMQVRWKYHKDAVRKDFPNVKHPHDMFDARVNIFYGTKLFAEYMMKANNDLRGGLMGYSAGGVKLTTKVLATVKELKSKDTNMNTKTKTKKGK
jgi:soluble lytic murein transglycosylase-like protein